MRRYDIITMNKAFSGHCEGRHLGVEMSKVSSDDSEIWVTWEWGFFGNGREALMKESCGSPVLDEEGNFVSFFSFFFLTFRFLDPSGFAVGVAATTVQTWGYMAVNVGIESLLRPTRSRGTSS
jgi:hypothetical protein